MNQEIGIIESLCARLENLECQINDMQHPETPKYLTFKRLGCMFGMSPRWAAEQVYSLKQRGHIIDAPLVGNRYMVNVSDFLSAFKSTYNEQFASYEI